MIRTFAKSATLAVCVLAAACQTKPKDEITVSMGPDGKMAVFAGNSPEDQLIAALLQQKLNKTAADKPALKEDEVWRKDAEDNLIHIQSGALCPKTWGGYTRDLANIFRPDGLDVGCNYQAPNGATLTFYVYKNPQPLADELKSTMETVKTRQPVSRDAPFSMPSVNGGYVASTLAYTMANGAPVRTSTILAQGGSWRLKIRLTCRADTASEVESAAAIALMGQRDRLNTPPPPGSSTPPI